MRQRDTMSSLEHDILPSLLSAGWFQEQIQVLFYKQGTCNASITVT